MAGLATAGPRCAGLTCRSTTIMQLHDGLRLSFGVPRFMVFRCAEGRCASCAVSLPSSILLVFARGSFTTVIVSFVI